MFLYLLYIYKKPIIVSLFNIDTLNFTMYILANLTYSLKTYVRLSNLIWLNILFTIKDHSFNEKAHNSKEKAENKQITKAF